MSQINTGQYGAHMKLAPQPGIEPLSGEAPQTALGYQTTMIRGLLGALVARGQIHGGSGLTYDQYSDERKFIDQARKFLSEQERVDSIPLNPWDPRWKA